MNLQINIKQELTPKEILEFQDSFSRLANAIVDLEYGEMKLVIREKRPSITQFPMRSIRLD